MPRIAGVDVPNNKRIEVGLTYIFGIGRTLSKNILTEAGISLDKRGQDLTDNDIASIRKVIEEKTKVEGDLRKEVIEDRGTKKGFLSVDRIQDPTQGHVRDKRKQSLLRNLSRQ